MQPPMFSSELTEEQVQAVTDMEPACAHCGEVPEFIYFHILETRRVWREVDGSRGFNGPVDRRRLLINIERDAYDTTLRQPRGDDSPLVECVNGHKWIAEEFVVRHGMLIFRSDA